MGVNQVKFGDTTVMDISDSTVTPETLLSGVAAYNKAGNKIIGDMVVEHVEVEPVLETGTKSATITVGEESADIYCENVKSEVKALKTPHSATINNGIATFDCIEPNYVKSLKVSFEPIQDLHGYDHPWAGGAGKNKINITDRDVTVSGVNIKVVDGVITLDGTSTAPINYHLIDNMNFPEDTYIFNIQETMSAGIVAVQTSDGNKVASVAGAQFTASMSGFMWFNCATGTSFSNLVVKPMIRLATETDATFAPYSNICPISGRTEASVTRTGVNQWDEQWESGDLLVTSTGENHVNANRIRSTNYIPVTPNTNYYFLTQAYGNPIIAFYAKDKNYPYTAQNVGWKSITNGSFTTPEWCYFVRFYVNATSETYNGDIGLNYPSTATSYEPYNAETKTHQYQQEIYGGVDDFVNGGADSEYHLRNCDGTEDWQTNGSSGVYIRPTVLSPNAKSKGNALMSIYKKVSDGEAPPNGCWNWNSAGTAIQIRDERAMTASAFKTLIATDNNLQICYELATPTTISTSAEEITTLEGTNIITASGGEISECKYTELATIEDIQKDILPAQIDYSTEEKVVGTWVDGSTVYEKTYFGSLNSGDIILENFENKMPVEASGWLKNENGYGINLGAYIHNLQNWWSALHINPYNNLVIIHGSELNSGNYYITVKYITQNS